MKLAAQMRATTRKIGLLLFASAMGASAAIAAPIMYVDDGNGRLGTVDVVTGGVTVIGNMGVVMTDIAFDPSGNLYGLSFTGLYSVNATTAQATFIGNHGISGGNALVFGSNGTLYGAGNTTNSLFTINTATGRSTNLGNMGFASGGDLAFNDGNLYLATSGNKLARIDLANVANSLTVGSFGVNGVFGLATGDNGVLYAVADTTVYIVDSGTGAATNPVVFGGKGLGTAFGQSFFKEAVAVPEPASLALLGLGLAGLAGVRRRKIA